MRKKMMGGGMMMKRPMYKIGGKAMGSRTGFDKGQRVAAEKRNKEGYKHKGTLEKNYKEIMGEERKMPSAKSALFALTPTDAGARFVKGLRKKGINVKKIEEDILKEKMKSKEFRIGTAKGKSKASDDDDDKYRLYQKGGRVRKMGGGMMKRPMYKDGSPKTLLRRIGPEESKRMAQDPSRKKRMNDMMLRYPKGKQVDPEVREKLKKLLDSKKPKTMRKKMMGGGSLKSVDPKTQKGLSKLPTKVRNKMGFMKKGGKVK